MIRAIKEFLKYFLPPPIRAFNREIERILLAIKQSDSQREQDNLAMLAVAEKNAEAMMVLIVLERENLKMQAEKNTEILAQQLALERANLNAQAEKNTEMLAQQLALERANLNSQAEKNTEMLAQQLALDRANLNSQAEKNTEMLAKQLANEFIEMQQKIIDSHEIMKEMDRKIVELKTELIAQQNKNINMLSSEISTVAEYQKTIEKAVNSVEQCIPDKPIYWNSEFERGVVRSNWGDVSKWTDFPEKFLKLTSGLDSKSVETIIRILARQQKFLNNDAKTLDLFTRAEQEELRLLKEEFTTKIFKISDDLFAYHNYLLPIGHFESSVFYFKHGLDEVNSLDRVKGNVIVDVGGFIGDSVLILSELEPSMIYTFEAVPANFELLKKTVALNQIENVVAENVALGSEVGTLTMHIGGATSTAIDRPGLKYTGDIEMPVITLDDYVVKHNIEVALIKVDIEGGEPDFLIGAKRTICEQKPILLLSIYHNAHDFFELKPLIESWEIGYKFKIHKPTYGSASGETLLIAEVE